MVMTDGFRQGRDRSRTEGKDRACAKSLQDFHADLREPASRFTEPCAWHRFNSEMPVPKDFAQALRERQPGRQLSPNPV